MLTICQNVKKKTVDTKYQLEALKMSTAHTARVVALVIVSCAEFLVIMFDDVSIDFFKIRMIELKKVCSRK